MEPIMLILSGLALWKWLAPPPIALAPSPVSTPIEQIIAGRIVACDPGTTCAPPALIAPHGSLIPGVDFPQPTPVAWPAGLPLDAHVLKQLASYANGTNQYLWESPTQGRFIVTITVEGTMSVAPDMPMALFAHA